MSRTEVFSFSELNDDAKENARNQYRENNLDYEWWDAVYDDAKTIGTLFGLEIENIYFSGFWSQGDGACFEGSYRYQKGGLKAVKAYAPQDTGLHGIVKRLQQVQARHFYNLQATCKRRGHYMHSGCMSVDVYDASDRYRDIAETDIADNLREFADWIYQHLENEYKYLQSDEVIDESIAANGYEFTEDGSFYL